MRRLELTALMAVMIAITWMAAHGRQPVHTWFIFVDDLHVEFRDTGRLRRLVDRIAIELIQDGAMYTVRVSGPSQVSIDLTSDLGRLGRAADKLTGHALRADDVARILAMDPAPNEVSHRMDVALAALRNSLKEHLHREGPPSSLIFISSGYYDFGTYRGRWAETVRDLASADTEVFVADPRKPDSRVSERLERVTLSR